MMSLLSAHLLCPCSGPLPTAPVQLLSGQQVRLSLYWAPSLNMEVGVLSVPLAQTIGLPGGLSFGSLCNSNKEFDF